MHTPYLALQKNLLKLACCCALLTVAAAHPSAGQGLPPESFQSTTSANYTLGGTAVLTAASAGDPNGSGYLRLTEAVQYQAGYAVCNNTFPATAGFSIAFEFFSYGTKDVPADGFSVFLLDGDQTSTSTFQPGQTGGSLGYVGLSHAYLGVGIDEYGNFSNNEPPRIGGPGRTPQSVSLRGAGNGYQAGYPYLGGTQSLPYSLSVATRRAQVGSADYRRVFVNGVAQNGAFLLTIRIQHGDMIETVVNELSVPNPPANLRIGFAGSTGGLTGVHELRKLEVARAPFLRQDSTSTRQGQPVTFNVLSNDIFSYAAYAPGTVDLDIVQAGVQQTVTVPEQGTLSVSPAGLVTFTPLNTFKGTLTLPYSAKDQVGQDGTPSNLKVTIDAAAPLAVVLTSFSASVQGQQALLRWTTGSEVNNSHFVVKRSLDGKVFSKAALVAGQGTTNKSNSYSWVDTEVSALVAGQQPVYYLLEQVDADGTTSFSPVVVATLSGSKISLYPNPVSSTATLNLNELAAEPYLVQVFSITGQCLASYMLAGQQQHTLDLQHLLPGAYQVRVTGAGKTKTLPLYRR